MDPRRPGAHLDPGTEHQHGVEDAVLHVGDAHLGQLVAGLLQDCDNIIHRHADSAGAIQVLLAHEPEFDALSVTLSP